MYVEYIYLQMEYVDIGSTHQHSVYCIILVSWGVKCFYMLLFGMFCRNNFHFSSIHFF